MNYDIENYERELDAEIADFWDNLNCKSCSHYEVCKERSTDERVCSNYEERRKAGKWKYVELDSKNTK